MRVGGGRHSAIKGSQFLPLGILLPQFSNAVSHTRRLWFFLVQLIKPTHVLLSDLGFCHYSAPNQNILGRKLGMVLMLEGF